MNDNELEDREHFADVELIKIMEELGFELSHHEGIADWFVKNEGTCELTVPGAEELVEKLRAREQRIRTQSEIDGWLMGFKCSGEGFNGEYPYGDSNATDEEILKDIPPPHLLEELSNSQQENT